MTTGVAKPGVGMIKHDCYSFQQLWDSPSLNQKFARMRGHKSRLVSLIPFWRRHAVEPDDGDHLPSTSATTSASQTLDDQAGHPPSPSSAASATYWTIIINVQLIFQKCSNFGYTIFSTLHNTVNVITEISDHREKNLDRWHYYASIGVLQWCS